ncbi:hypothetical protein V5R04_01920 [Jonesiaceae bacterium BS-20]|uniref:Uncharacterized protein n=1 Tax=Jonesiaceae bacterium BS-20 TaxID=3120821 RepID=A0AAU7DY82_9MICO
MSNQSPQNIKDQRRAEARQYYEEQEANAARRERRRRRISLFVVGAMILSFAAPTLAFLFQ